MHRNHQIATEKAASYVTPCKMMSYKTHKHLRIRIISKTKYRLEHHFNNFQFN
jgi:hypothetical protein